MNEKWERKYNWHLKNNFAENCANIDVTFSLEIADCSSFESIYWGKTEKQK